MCEAGDCIELDDLAFVAGNAGGSTYGNNVVNTNHVADSAAAVLQSNDSDGRQVYQQCCFVLQRSEQGVGNGVGAGHEGAQNTDNGSHNDVCLAGQVGQTASHDQQHGAVNMVGGEVGVTEEVNHCNAEEQSDCSALNLSEGVHPCALNFFALHAMHGNGDQSNNDEYYAGRPQASVVPVLTQNDAGGAGADDNQWRFEPVDVEGMNIYDVVIEGNDSWSRETTDHHLR